MYRFSPPPNWPPCPPGWTPPAGWVPPPEWGPPPAGWVLWIRDEPTTTPSRAHGQLKKVKDSADRVVQSDRLQTAARALGQVARDERTQTALKAAAAIAFAATATHLTRRLGVSIPVEVTQAPLKALTAGKPPSSKNPELVRSDPFEIRLGWSTTGTLVKHPDCPQLWLEVSMPGINRYTLAVDSERSAIVPRTFFEAGDIPKRWTTLVANKVTLPVEGCRVADNTIACRWLLEPSDVHTLTQSPSEPLAIDDGKSQPRRTAPPSPEEVDRRIAQRRATRTPPAQTSAADHDPELARRLSQSLTDQHNDLRFIIGNTRA